MIPGGHPSVLDTTLPFLQIMDAMEGKPCFFLPPLLCFACRPHYVALAALTLALRRLNSDRRYLEQGKRFAIHHSPACHPAKSSETAARFFPAAGS